MKIINLTPHEIVVRLADGTDRRFAPDGRTCRCNPLSAPDGDLDGVPVVRSSFGDLFGLPETAAGIVYLVSTPAAQKASASGRTDVVSPDTGPTAIRDGGQIVAVRGFQRF